MYTAVYVIMHPVNGFVLVCGPYYIDILAVASENDIAINQIIREL